MTANRVQPWLDDGDVTLYHGDALTVLQRLPAGIAQACVTSPPYWGLRDYGTGQWTGGDEACDHSSAAPSSDYEAAKRRKVGYQESGRSTGQHGGWEGRASTADGRDVCRCGARRVDSQLGLEATPIEYVENMVNLFREVRRVLRDDGTLWLNLGDSYTANPGSGNANGKLGGLAGADSKVYQATMGAAHGASDEGRGGKAWKGLPGKNLVGIPWKVAFALQADGWYLRSDIIWSKPNPMPESVTDRPTKAHEYVFLFSKQPRYFYDADAIREPATYFGPNGQPQTGPRAGEFKKRAGMNGEMGDEAGRNRRSVWTIPTEPFPEAHFATYPQALVQPCIQAGTSEQGECVKCGRPRRRQTETEYVKSPVHGAGSVVGRHYETGANGWDGSGVPRLDKHVTTIGWDPGCPCSPNAQRWDYRPQLVLDPFIGSGTTALVARKHGRRCIGIDLSAEYLAIAAKRTQQLSLLGGVA